MAEVFTALLLDDAIGAGFGTKLFSIGIFEVDAVILSAGLGAKDLAFDFGWSRPSGLHAIHIF